MHSQEIYETTKEILFYDSLFLCTGLGTTIISKYFNPIEWLIQSISLVITQLLANPVYGTLLEGQQVLRGRVMWLLSCWLYHFNDINVINSLMILIVNMFDNNYGSDIVTRLYSLG